MNLSFSEREIRDLGVAWLALGVAFTLLLEPQLRNVLFGQLGGFTPGGIARRGRFAVAVPARV